VKDYIVLYAVIDPMYLEPYIKSMGADFDAKWKDRESLMSNHQFRSIVYKDVVRVAQFHKLNRLEIPKHMKLTLKPFTVEADLLTPTQKLKRNVARKTFDADIEQMYKEGP